MWDRAFVLSTPQGDFRFTESGRRDSHHPLASGVLDELAFFVNCELSRGRPQALRALGELRARADLTHRPPCAFEPSPAELHDLAAWFNRALRSGQIRAQRVLPPRTRPRPRPLADVPLPTRPDETEPTDAFVGVRVIDQYDKAVADVRVRLVLPDGSVRVGTTDSQGLLLVTGIEQEGDVEITLL
jgi:hypothetical protein